MKSKSLNLRVDLQALPDEAVMPRKEKGFGEKKEMKKRIVLFAALVFLCSMFTLAVCEETRGSSSIASILNAWGAKDGQELYTRILDHWNRNIDGTRISWPAKIRLGGTTEDLISKPGSWDLAIVSSKDVDLQKLADEGLVQEYGFAPIQEFILHQWLLPDELQSLLPEHPFLAHQVYFYDYDYATGEATLLICKHYSGEPSGVPGPFARAILGGRSADAVRAVEGIVRVEAPPPAYKVEPGELLNWEIDDLLSRPRDWDVANILIQNESDLDALDRAGLLYDFSQDNFWLTRSYDWSVPSGVYSEDGRLIAIPYIPYYGPAESGFWVTVVNTRCQNLSKAMAYVTHWIKTDEWAWGFYTQEKTEEEDVPEEIRKYGICMYKDEMDW